MSKSDFLYNRFNLLANKLEEFVLCEIDNEESAKLVSSQFESVLSKCDEIDYEDYSTTIAYVILHFLPRYHLFQLAFSKLLDKHILPYKKQGSNILDIGTGPGPALYALSDIYESLFQFGVLKKDFRYMPDYVEQSAGFRNFLHHFTEFLNYRNTQDERWDVPYHHGSFDKFEEIEFNQLISDFWGSRRYIKYRYNIITCANFFTRSHQVEKLKHEIQDCARYLRNKGIFVVLGAQSSESKTQDKNYAEIYRRIGEIVENSNYSTNRIIAKAKQCKVKKKLISFDYSCKFGVRINKFHKNIINKLDQYGALDAIVSDETKKKIIDITKSDYSYTYKTEVHVFIKKSRPKFLTKRNIR